METDRMLGREVNYSFFSAIYTKFYDTIPDFFLSEDRVYEILNELNLCEINVKNEFLDVYEQYNRSYSIIKKSKFYNFYFDRLVQKVYFVKKPKNENNIAHSDKRIPGRIIYHCEPSVDTDCLIVEAKVEKDVLCALDLIHEATHQWLFILESASPLVKSESRQVFSIIRNTFRPEIKSFHAFVVEVVQLDFISSILEDSKSLDWAIKSVLNIYKENLMFLLREFREILNDFHLTDLGNSLKE